MLGRGKKHYVINALRPDRDPLMSVNDLAIPLKSIDFAAILYGPSKASSTYYSKVQEIVRKV